MVELLIADRRKNSYSLAYFQKNGALPPLFLVSSYKTAAEHFRVIDDMTSSVIVPYGDGKEIIAEFNSNKSIYEFSQLLRKAQQYTINIFDYEREQLIKNDGLVRYLDGKVLALKEGAYDKEFGLNLENDSHLDASIF